MTDSKVTYKATLTLTQEGLDGDVKSLLVFDPLVAPENPEVPDVYEIMSALAQNYLYIAGIVDEEGDLIDREAFEDNTKLIIREPRGSLN